MRAFVAGATGVLGRRLVRQLAERGNDVIGLARDPAKAELIRKLGGRPVSADLFDADSLAKAMTGCDVVIRAATSIPAGTRTRLRDFAMNDRIRTEGARAIVEAASIERVPAYLHESIVWDVGPPDGAPYDEDAPPRAGAYIRGTLDGERIAREEGGRRGIDVAVLRCGFFYAPDAVHTRTIGRRLAKRALPIIGDGRAVWSMIHAEDAASAFAVAAESPRTGVWHIVDDRPVAVAELFTDLARRLGAPPPRRVPVWLAMLIGGSLTVEILTTSFRTSSGRFQRDFGWKPQYPTYQDGFAEVLATWEAEGFPPRRRG